MHHLTLLEILETSRSSDLLEDEHGTLWLVRDLLDALRAGKSAAPKGALPGLTRDSLIFIDGEHMHPASAEGAIGQTPVLRRLSPPEKPYRVLALEHGYRIIFVEHEGQWKYRFIEGRLYYPREQAAYRRKELLNINWLKHGLPQQWAARELNRNDRFPV